ncbi:MAG: hypothetical protein KGH87_01975 [Thaumarchaeota archaeon]|nr:hypothetical protein [Nitrososphaerota archaeon]MDE1838665.1 hypothetical protein [Nitrososphaerota archaeon]
MKTLHYCIITISLIGVSFFVSEDAYGCLGNCPPITPPPHYASSPITVHTNLENYSTGDNIIITGHIFNQTKDTPLMIKIFDPIRQLQFDKNVPVSSNGNYTWTLSTVDFWSFDASGNYTVLAQYGQVYAITNFNLNSTLTQYLYAQSPLWQFHNGMPAEDVHCHAGFSLIIRKENFAPACTHPITATNLILSGWALGTPPIKLFINSIDMSGLRQNYTVGQPIDATVNYAGYWSRAWEPDVKIFDANDTQIWFNCLRCITNNVILGGGPSIPSYGNFTYHVQDYNGRLPIINKTGTYTMVASLDNKTASAEIIVVKPSMLPASFEPCDTPYPQSNTGVAVLYMSPNSTGKICATYHNPDSPTQSNISVFIAKDMQQQASEITTSASPDIVPTGNSTIVYTIKTGSQAGFYGISFFCNSVPFVVGYDNQSRIILDDFPWLYKNDICLSQTNVFQITGLSGIHVKYVTEAHRG